MAAPRILALLLALATALPAFGQQAALASGEVRKVDKAAKTITLKHGPIPNIDMPAMTMMFEVKDPAMLDKVKPGDKVRFQADMVNSKATVTRLEAAK